MNGMNQTHGAPMVRTLTVGSTAGLQSSLVELEAETIYLQINGGGSGTVRIYFSQAEFARVIASGTGASDAYIEVGPTGLFQGPAQVRRFFALGIGAPATFQVVGYRKIA